MKYAGSIAIYDDEGNVAYERDLSADEMMDLLLEALANPEVGDVDEPEEEVEAEPEPARKRTPPATDAQPAAEGKKPRLCGNCGKPGHTVRTCPTVKADDARRRGDDDQAEEISSEEPAEVVPPKAFKPADGAMSSITFLEVKQMQEDEKPSMVIASRKRLTLQEVGFAMKANTYSEYLKIRAT
jgi:hypothetical protein